MEEYFFVNSLWSLDWFCVKMASVCSWKTFSSSFPMMDSTVIPLYLVGRVGSLTFFRDRSHEALQHHGRNITTGKNVVHQVSQRMTYHISDMFKMFGDESVYVLGLPVLEWSYYVTDFFGCDDNRLSVIYY